jgi:nitrite reductase (NADH) large subunit
MIRKAGDVVCIGGGILGLETAAALARRGARVTLLESHEWILPRQLNRRAGELLADYAMRSGISILTHARTKEILGDERAAGVQLEDGKVIHAGSIIISAGVRPNSYLARRASLHVNQGIVVDDHLRSSHPDVFAAGDIAEHRGVLYGIWSPAQYQGFIAGSNSAGRLMEFGGIPMSHTLKVLGIGMTSIGTVEFLDGSYLVAEEENGGAYCRFVFRDGALVGALFLGDTGVSGFAKKAIEDHTDFSDLLSKSPACRDIIETLAQKTASL